MCLTAPRRKASLATSARSSVQSATGQSPSAGAKSRQTLALGGTSSSSKRARSTRTSSKHAIGDNAHTAPSIAQRSSRKTPSRNSTFPIRADSRCRAIAAWAVTRRSTKRGRITSHISGQRPPCRRRSGQPPCYGLSLD
eukprot:Amastigsp_a684423_28.p1 type:complete len:139 gc:universal Amastigsp_a684423_28:450-34(-)